MEIRILLVEDDADLAVAMSEYLELQGAECDFAYHGESGLLLAQKHRFDVIVLDLMLPRINGVEVCEQLRLHGVSTPILMLTACDENTQQLRGFQAGIDDYVIKPSPMPLIWARVQALHRRNKPIIDKLSVDTLTCYFKEQRVTREGRDIKLTPTGWKILSLLMRRYPEVVSRSEIEEYVWPDGDVERGNFNVQLHQLRKSVDKPFKYVLIQTLTGRGICIRKSSGQDNG
jgi:DNA-binding response OmpR family regulator